MATMADAIRDAFTAVGSRLTRQQLRDYIDAHHANEWEPSTLGAHLYACAVNNPKAYIHHRHAQRFLFRHPDNTFELYDERAHGPNVWGPRSPVPDDGDGVDDAEQLIEGLPHS